MLLTSIEYYFFLTAVFAVWIAAPVAKRTTVLLIAGYLFYFAWQPWFPLVILFCTLVSWIAGIRMANTTATRKKRRILLTAVAMNLLPLVFFKYFTFLSASVRPLLLFAGLSYPIPHLDLLLPVGISFYTFQAVSYCADVYNQKIDAESDVCKFALYLSFFPKLISGPIERGAALLPQISMAGLFNSRMFVSGAQLFLWGVFKKIVIADRLGMYVDMVFDSPEAFYGKTAIIAMWMFSLQIYCDFSAYMDMAIGSGRIFGIELSRNFNFPYMARSIGEFWRRWHMTLTSWFRDYMYIPLGGNRVPTRRWAWNIMIVFLISGLWHGAAWTFVWWGALHGFFYLVGKFTAASRKRLRERLGIRGRQAAALQMLFTFQLVSLAWVFFRAETIEDAFCLIQHMIVNLSLPVRMMSSQFSTALAFGVAIVFVGMELVLYWANRKGIDLFHSFPPVIKYPACALGLLMMALFGVGSNEFIYFQF